MRVGRVFIRRPLIGFFFRRSSLTAARQRTGKPTLTMKTLAQRLSPQILFGLLCHLDEHIALREDREDLDRRAKRIYPKKANLGARV